MAMGPRVLNGGSRRGGGGPLSGLSQKALTVSSPLYHRGIIPFLRQIRRPLGGGAYLSL